MKFGIFSLLVVASIGLSAQSNWTDKFYVGGGFGISAGNNETNISLSPQVGYKVTSRYSVGFGITYQYVKIKSIDVSINNYGWSLFNRYNITQQFFAYMEYENLQFEVPLAPSFEESLRLGYNSFLIGGGYSEALGGRASFSVTALYNVLYDPADDVQPYNSPWVIRAGVGLGIF